MITVTNNYEEGCITINIASSIPIPSGSTKLRVKRKKSGTTTWVTSHEITLSATPPGSLNLKDRLSASKTEYVYGLTFVLSTGYESAYITSDSIKSEFDGVWICEADSDIFALMNIQISSFAKSNSTGIVKPIDSKYPFIFRSELGSPERLNVSAFFAELKDGKFDTENGHIYRRDVINKFLTNGHTKVVKAWDGRIWLGSVASDITESDNEHEDLIITSFDFVEIGDLNSNTDMIDFDMICTEV